MSKTIFIRSQRNRMASQTAEASFRQIIDLSPDAILVQVNNRIVFANTRALQLFDADSIQDLLGRSIFQFLHADTKYLVKAQFEALQNKPEHPEILKHQVTTLKNSLIRVETIPARILWNDEKAIQIRVREITSQMEFESQLRESEAKFHQLADAMPQIVWMANAEGKSDYRNKKFFEQTGVTDQEGDAAKIWSRVLHPDDAKNAERNWNHSVVTGEKFQMEYRYKDLTSAGYRWHLGRALPIKDSQGKIIRWFGTCTDIHDQKTVEIALHEAKEQLAANAAELEKLVTDRTTELEGSVRSSEALNYSIAHDLRAPLRAMMGFSGTLLDEYATELDARGQDYARRIAAAAKGMDNLINALLAYGRLDYEELPFGFVNIEKVLEELLNDFSSEMESTHARIILTRPLPNVWANAVMMKKILNELIENAFKFRASERPLLIEIWAEERETKNLIWIRDNGIGIPPQHYERVFRILESLHARNEYSGTGIGLAIVRRAVERMGGQIGLKPGSKQGSCFWIELPKAFV